MNDKDRMTLAKAMGAQFTTISNGSWAHVNMPGGGAFKDWHPDTDANDDYGVLRWMRKRYEDRKYNDTWSKFSAHLYYVMRTKVTGYSIGDYARAALKVIE